MIQEITKQDILIVSGNGSCYCISGALPSQPVNKSEKVLCASYCCYDQYAIAYAFDDPSYSFSSLCPGKTATRNSDGGLGLAKLATGIYISIGCKTAIMAALAFL